jgi:AmmeMemoRadiSam system protein B
MLCVILVTLIVSTGTGCQRYVDSPQKQAEAVVKRSLSVAISHDTQAIIEKSLRKNQTPFVWSHHTKGVVVPHHMLQGDLIAACFRGLKDLDPQVVILLSPNHMKQIEHSIITVNQDLETYKGILSVSSATDDLLDKGLATNAPQVLLEEYGLSNLLPYIQDLSWNAELIPLVTSRGLTDQEISRVYETIAKATEGKRVLWIASIDFSHGLSALESRSRDAMTLDWIDKRAVNSIMSSGPEHMDNPSGLIMWMKAMKSFKVVYQGESGSKSEGTLHEAGTSYLIFEGQ